MAFRQQNKQMRWGGKLQIFVFKCTRCIVDKEEEDGAKGTIGRETKRKGQAEKGTEGGGKGKEENKRRKRERNQEYRRDAKTPTITSYIEK